MFGEPLYMHTVQGIRDGGALTYFRNMFLVSLVSHLHTNVQYYMHILLGVF